MKSPTSIIGGVITLALLTACSAAYDYAAPGFIGNVRGLVTDTEGAPLNHIKVTLDCGAELGQTTVYTSMKGEFLADINPDTQLLVITLEDIDGEENGGQFEPMSDQITLLDENPEDDQDIISLEYRLTHATASESSPQSL